MKKRFLYFLVAMFFIQYLNASASSYNNDSKKVLPSSYSSRSLDVFADFIFWTAKEVGADCWAEVIEDDSTSSSNDLEQVKFGWDPGFKVGFTHKIGQNNLDMKLFYTWFKTTGKDSLSKKAGSVHSTFLGNFYVDNPLGLNLSGPSYQFASISWKIAFNMFDFEILKKIWIDKPLCLQPFFGVKTGWIDQSINTKWQNPDVIPILYFNEGEENLKNNYWGIGPKLGVNTKWSLYKNQTQFYLLGDFSTAVMWGNFSFFDLFENDINQKISANLEKINTATSMIHTFMGFGWEKKFKNQTGLFAKLGYEMQFWLNQLQFYSFTGGRFNNMLTLQGGTVEFYFDF